MNRVPIIPRDPVERLWYMRGVARGRRIATKSSVFGRCPSCSRTTINGICVGCGYARVCCHCKRVCRPDGIWIPAPPEFTGDEASHGFCESCIIEHHPKFAKKMGLIPA
jgi:hypothetical protein